MAEVVTSKKVGEVTREAKVEFNIPETLGELVATYGEKAIAALARAQLVIQIQRIVRPVLTQWEALTKDQDPEKAQEVINSKAQERASAYKPGERAPRVPRERKPVTVESVAADISALNMTPEQTMALIQQLKAKRAA